ncbi:MAG: GNAT family N-acetyltransferase [Lachnospiraceae bacterium]|nr:GNAT family N-acetyltransferase [Lachnospiraceae bacterium]
MIRRAGKEDIKTLAGLAVLMWKDSHIDELAEDFQNTMQGGDAAFFLCFEEGEQPIGFAQCQLRQDYVEGTKTSPVGYLEGIFVKEGYRRAGHAKKLLWECEKWAQSKGCVEFASDCELDNTGSYQFHMKAGFAEANRVICFTKKMEVHGE